MTSINKDELLAAGMPEPIVAWVDNLARIDAQLEREERERARAVQAVFRSDGFDELADALAEQAPPSKEESRHVQRARRFVDHWRANPDDESAAKAWAKVAESAPSDDSLISFFASFPDQLTMQPFAAMFGHRSIDPGAEMGRYAKRLEQVRGVLELLGTPAQRPEFSQLLSDAAATPQGKKAVSEFLAVYPGIVRGLRGLANVLDVVDPFAKVPTAHWKSPVADRKIYVGLVSSLSRHLTKPQWAAISRLANVNLPKGKVSADDLRKHSGRSADKLA